MTKRRIRFIGFLVLLIGILISPVKEWAVRCRSNPWGWLEAECQAFKEAHWLWGYAIFAIGIVLILVSLFSPSFNRDAND
ncbi:hypothetical protein [Qipengyuania sp. 902]|uniref:hypothetical protein n=1 Tax=Qipengyuania sp. 902 TaxID=3417565 RepID=UPI003EBAB49F